LAPARLTPEEEKEAVQRYEHIPKAAAELAIELRKLQVKVESGVTYGELRAAIDRLHPDVVVFAESKEAKPVPEMAFVLMNASRCYLAMRQLWNEELFGPDALQRGAAGICRLHSAEVLRSTAAANVSLARGLAEGKPEGSFT
jgi:hypothetical protein